MILKISIFETQSAVFFECTTRKWVCSGCGNKYEKKIPECLKCSKKAFKVVDDIKLGHISKVNERWGCTCIYGSFYRFSNFWLDNYPEVKCRHYRKAFREWQKQKRSKK